MKISYKHLLNNLPQKPNIEDVSQRLFQLGHEHEINDQIFDIEFTPNRGDCLSVKGLLRDLRQFFEVSENENFCDSKISSFDFNFKNMAKKSCKKISFMKVEIDKVPSKYNDYLESYFSDLEVKKNNFFTDVSNYISYETGQPTHCYDVTKINEPIKLECSEQNYSFETLLGKEIILEKENLLFFDKNNEVINLAGIVGGKSTSCNNETKSVLIECAFFDPEAIIGKSIKYGINSDAAYKFERNVDPDCHNYVLRRFLRIIMDHTSVNNVEIFSETYDEINKTLISLDIQKINKVLGTSIDKKTCVEYLKNFGFEIQDDLILVPSYRNDVRTINDISEEIARAIGYDNIQPKVSNINIERSININKEEKHLREILLNNGFFEVINDPFVSDGNESSFEVDNPLDSKRKFLRLDLKNSLIKNLLYNERRQKDSIKLFEISDVYSVKSESVNKVIGIIASGRVGRNYQDFSKKIDNNYLINLLSNFKKSSDLEIINIPRESIDSKLKNKISYVEIKISQASLEKYSIQNESFFEKINNTQYSPISEYPFSIRDLSFSIKDYAKSKSLEKFVLGFEDKLLKEIFVFDYFKNDKLEEIKIGFRFVFQSKKETITDSEVDVVMDKIISNALLVDDSITIPGLD